MGCFLGKLVVVKCVEKGLWQHQPFLSTQQVPDLPKEPFPGAALSNTMLCLRVIYPALLRRRSGVATLPPVRQFNGLVQISLCNQVHVSRVLCF